MILKIQIPTRTSGAGKTRPNPHSYSLESISSDCYDSANCKIGKKSGMKGIRIKAILAGIAIDILGSILVGIVEGVIIFVIASRAGDTSRQHLLELKSKFLAEFSGLLGTTFSTGLGGYASARLSQLNNLYNPLIVGVISLLSGLQYRFTEVIWCRSGKWFWALSLLFLPL
jgi:hypothetical protein